MNPRDILLTTYPGHKSQNVGDNLIAESAMALVRARCPGYSPTVLFREQSLDSYSPDLVRTILAPGFSVSNDTYPKLFRLYSDLAQLKSFFPVGCSFQHPLPGRDSFDSYEFNEATLDVLGRIAEMCGGIPCRDMLIEGLLRRHGIRAHYCGDLALFDEQYIGTDYMPPAEVRSIVFTIHHHHARFDDQSKVLLALIASRFAACRKYIAFHSKPNGLSNALAAHAATLGFEELHMYGDSSNLDKYDFVDLHIGYRLHGHIAFLRKRKPSVLLVEDSRSFGFANSGVFSTGCFDALDLHSMQGLQGMPEQVLNYVENEIGRGFASYGPVFDMIDDTYKNTVSPYFDHFCSLIN